MVTRKRSTKKDIVPWKQRALEKAKSRQAIRPVSTENQVISIKGGIFTYNGAPLPEILNVIILDEVVENSYYTKPYSENEFQAPVCYAFSEPVSTATGELGEGMHPHEKSPTPQSVECKGCRQNEFGTSPFGSGAGKACGNRRRLLVMSADNLKSLDKAMVALLKVPPTGLKVWDAYVNWLYRIEELSPEYAITALSLKKLKPTDQSALPCFDFIGMLPDDVCDQVETIIERNRELLLQPFPEQGGDQPPPRAKAKRATKKRAVRR